VTAPIEVETLVAYVDGELDETERRRVEEVLDTDEEARQVVRDLRVGAAQLRAVLDEPLREPVPERIHAAIDRAFAERAGAAARSDRRRRSWGRRAAPLLAASVAALAVGLGGGYYLGVGRLSDRLARLEAARLEDRALLEQTVSRALEKQLSGVAVDWRNPNSGSYGTVTPVRTFRNADGQWCREYAAASWLHDRRESRRAIACREADGVWRTRIEIAGES